jgi:hypothetical protein
MCIYAWRLHHAAHCACMRFSIHIIHHWIVLREAFPYAASGNGELDIQVLRPSPDWPGKRWPSAEMWSTAPCHPIYLIHTSESSQGLELCCKVAFGWPCPAGPVLIVWLMLSTRQIKEYAGMGMADAILLAKQFSYVPRAVDS